jgi:hypothetical protein
MQVMTEVAVMVCLLLHVMWISIWSVYVRDEQKFGLAKMNESSNVCPISCVAAATVVGGG